MASTLGLSKALHNMVNNGLTTQHFMLRPFQRADLKAFAAYRADPQVAKYQSWSNYSDSDAITLYEGMDYTQFGAAGNWFQLVIVSTAGATLTKLVGDLALHFIDEQQVEIGFTIAPEYQGQHIAFEAVSALLDYLFIELDKHRVIAVTDTQNLACCRLLEKLHFRREANYVKNTFFKGAWGDEYLYAMLKNEY
ncbi:Protein N-acetyltransferase, RimJ/RimL family [Shewanella morhuae]|uniref:GNAT family N-acetyltransferase n=1 Tax=Shewanella morhuae TaxID=365591 RepID=UPI000954B103|nr:GNAT family protein [Shewanella morhuae]SIQ42285.1 Protein N-acetyltransferase, RimJ/RimL family [Shewanella morhuae]